MKKFLPYILILVVLTGIFSITPNMVEAAGACINTVKGQQANLTEAECKSKTYTDLGYSWDASAVPAAGTGTPNGIPPTEKPSDPKGCNILSAGTWGDCLSSYVLAPIAYLILGIASFILYVAGTILDFVLKYTIVDMAAHINGGISSFDGGEIKALLGINIAWKIIRDLMNIAFIFILVYEGIKLIIGQSDLGKIKSFITFVVLASLLINFSLFFTKVMIDASNIVTTGIYNSIIDSSSITIGGETTTGGAKTITGLSVPYMNSLGLTGIYSGKSFGQIKKDVGSGTNMFIFFLMGSVVFTVVAFVFFAVACMFIIRYITLIILLMLSPVAYMGMALPFMKPYAKQWWDSLNGQLVFAPVFMIMNLVILTLMKSPGFLSNDKQWAGITTGDIGSISLIFNFVVVIGLAIASLVIAKSTSTEGSKYISTMSKNFTSFAGGAVMGGAGWAGRTTLGRMGNRDANNEKLIADAETKKGLSGAWARSKLYVGRQAAGASFDARNASVPTSVLGDLVEGTVGRTATGKKLGLNNVNISNVGAVSQIADLAGVGKGSTKGFKETSDERAKELRKRETEAATELAIAQAKIAIINGANTNPAHAFAAVGSAEHTAYTEAIDKMEKALAKLSDKETETLVANNRELMEKQEFANRISVKQLEALNKSDQLSEGEKTKLKDKRFEGVRAIYEPAALAAHAAASLVPIASRTPEQKAAFDLVENAPKRIKGLTDSEIEMMDPTSLTESKFISQLRPAQFESIAKSSKFTSSQKKTIKDTRLAPLLDALDTSRPGHAPNPAEVKKMITKGLTTKDVAGLMSTDADFTDPTGTAVRASILTHPEVLKQYNPNILKRMSQDMSPGDIQTLKDAINFVPHGFSPEIDRLAAWLLTPDGINNFA